MLRAFLLLTLASADVAAKCNDCVCVGVLTALRDPDPTDVALNAKVRTGYVPDPAKSEHFVLRAVGGPPLTVSETQIHIDAYDTLVLTPVSPLAKNTEYELVLLRGERTLPYAKLKTTDGTDTSAPIWEGKLEARYDPPDGCKVGCQERRGARITVTAPVPKDDRSGADLIGVWIGASLDYDKPASGYLAIDERNTGSLGLGSLGGGEPKITLVLGGEGPCHRPNLKLPVGTKQLRIGMKLIDRAGNASLPREVLVKIPKPLSSTSR
jgi:hypothetical protein